MTMRTDATRTRIPITEKRRLRAVAARQGQVLLDTDVDQQSRHHLERLEIETVDTLGGSPGRLLVPAGNTGFKITPDGAPLNFNIGAGRGYLDGWLLENPAVCKLTTQPHPRTGDTITVPTVVAIKALVRHIDPVEEPKLADVALGDAQAAGRTLNDWQVLPFNITGAQTITCATVLSNATWQALTAPSTGTLAVQEQAAAPSTDPCSLTPGGGYTRLENLLYRIEVHGGDVNAAFPTIDGPRCNLHNLKIKFSRRNASVMVRIDKITVNEFKVSPPVLDPRIWFAPGQYAEIVSIHDDVDPRAALANERLFRVANASDDIVKLEATGAQITATGASDNGTWFLRVWDAFPGGGGIATVSAPSNAATSAEIDLGDGLKVTLGNGGSTGTFRRGDYWTCAARADGTTDWPKTGNVGNPMTPHGPEVRYAPLAAMTGANAATTVEDCRIPFATLSDRALLYRGGDGQGLFSTAVSGMVALPAKLRVAVMRGETPVVGATVRWSFVGPGGASCQINGALCNAAANVETTSDTNGLVEVTWSIDAARRLDLHQVKAALVGATAPLEPPVVFTAVFETAAHTSYTPGACSHLVTVTNVQDALDTLCSKITDTPDALTLRAIRLLDVKLQPTDLILKEALLLNGLDVRFNSFVSGIRFELDGGIPSIAVKPFDPVVEVELDLPYPITDHERLYWVQASEKQVAAAFGFQRVRLDGTVEVEKEAPDGGKPGLIWRPSQDAVQFIESSPRHLWGQRITPQLAAQLKEFGWAFKPPVRRILCRIRLRSALIWVDAKQGRLYLNAEHLGTKEQFTNRELVVKERDPQRAADLDIFVYLVPEAGGGFDKPIKDGGVIIKRGAVAGTGGRGRGRGRKGSNGGADASSLAPFYPTPQELVVKMLELGGLRPGERLFDLGSGDGRIVIIAARQFGADATGFERDRRLWQQTTREIKRLKLQNTARTVLGDATKQDVSGADVVTLYLCPTGNARIRAMLETQLKPGARVVSHDYEIAGWRPQRTERIEDEFGRGHTLFAYAR
jgi:hypothetical protein